MKYTRNGCSVTLPDDYSIPCLVCDKILSPAFDAKMSDIAKVSFIDGVECRTFGGYGSTVHDSNGALFFALCDECLIKKSHKMILIEKNTCSSKSAFVYYTTEFLRSLVKRADELNNTKYLVRILQYFSDNTEK